MQTVDERYFILISLAQIAWFFLGVASHHILKAPLGLL